MRTVLTLTEQAPGQSLIWFGIGILGLAAGVVIGVLLSVRGISRSDDRVAKVAQHQRQDPAVRAWLATLPTPRYPRRGATISHQDSVDWGAGDWGAGADK